MVNADARLVVGLGNPGTRYHRTRHNAGFDAIDALLDRAEPGVWSELEEKRFKYGGTAVKALLSESVVNGEKRVLVKPLSFMNESGSVVKPVLEAFGAGTGQMLVLYDDISLELGRMRIRPAGSDGGQNGLASIIQALGTQSVPRLRIGIGPKDEKWDLSDFVLSKWSDDDYQTLRQTLKTVCDAVEYWFENEIELVMNRFNTTIKNEE